ncbi:hypothetical protein EEL30_21545 [Brevibacillus laterosporus]|uniref:Uncharacterized protein n=1 Tax=Brevibacillus laterosporus TaxID=1465 RepID=A0A518VCC2_BRELA|nr:hypothetical protein EEL30_21545 [Brevibacillus laterosporus]
MMIVKPYVITWESLKERSLIECIDIPMYAEILSFEVNNRELIMNVLQDNEQKEKHSVKIALIQSGIDVTDMIEKNLIFYQTIRFNNKSYHVFCNEFI